MLAESVLSLTVLLAVGFLATRVAKAFRLPHSVFLVLLGVAAGAIVQQWHWSALEDLSRHFPEIILFVLLPPLVFESAYNLPVRDLRRDLVPVSALAVVGLLLSTTLVGAGLHFAFGIGLLPALVFGALISATDPLAVVSLFKEIGAPRRLNTLVEGESLLNDGTAIVLFRVLTAAMAMPVVDGSLFATGVAQFFKVAFGGLAVGVVLALAISLLMKAVTRSPSAQLGLTVAFAYLSFLLAEHVLHVSGVMATMVVGLYIGSRARLELSKEALHGMHHLWEFLSLTANSVVFFAVGLTVDLSILAGSLGLIPGTIAIVYVSRALSVALTLLPVNFLKVANPIGWAYQAVLIWGGLRGGIALGLVLLLPDSFELKQLFLALATSVVLSTLFVNALTVAPLMRALGLDRLDPRDQKFFDRTLALAHEEALRPVREACDAGVLSRGLLDERAAQASALVDPDPHFSVRYLLLTERKIYDERLEDGILSKRAYEALIKQVNRRLEAFDSGGMKALEEYPFDFERRGFGFHALSARLGRRHYAQAARLSLRFEVILNLSFGVEEAAASMDQPELRALASRWSDRIRERVEQFYRVYPDYGAAVQALFVANTVKAVSDRTIHRLHCAAVVSAAVLAKVEEELEHEHDEAAESARALLDPGTEYLLSRVPILRGLPRNVIGDLASRAKLRTVVTGDILAREGEEGDSLFLVVAGIFGIHSAGFPPGMRPRLFAGDFFGEMAFVFRRPRNATVTAEIPGEVVEISRASFDALIEKYPSVGERVREVARERQRLDEAARVA